VRQDRGLAAPGGALIFAAGRAVFCASKGRLISIIISSLQGRSFNEPIRYGYATIIAEPEVCWVEGEEDER
jgi:hypothetical protein